MSNLIILEKDVASWVKEMAKPLEGYAVREYKQSAFLKSLNIAILENPVLQECLKTPAGKSSLIHALRSAAGTGLSLNPGEGKAALIAYKGKDGVVVSYQVMKNGLIELAMGSGKFEYIVSDVVRENDIFEPPANPDSSYRFLPARKDRGEIDGFFCAAKMKDGSLHFKYMSLQEIREHRDKYSAMYQRNPERSPWKNSENGMAVKTVIKALLRNLAVSPEVNSAVGADDKFEGVTIETTATVSGCSSDDALQKIEENEPQKEKKGQSKYQATGKSGKLDFE